MKYRTGNGFDVHRFGDEAPPDGTITLGGVQVKHERALVAHSDGDVLVHALCDALLGALALGDIGHHFPDTDEKYRNANSLELLVRVYALIQERDWQLINADITVLAEAPKLAPHNQAMRKALSSILNVDMDQISIKATTTEGLGFTGRGEGIAVYAAVMLGREAADTAP